MSDDGIECPPLSAGNLKRIRSLHQKKYRDAESAFLAEGVRLCEEALASHVTIRQFIVTTEALKNPRVKNLTENCRRGDIPLFLATPEQFKALSEEQTPQGVAVVVSKPKTKNKMSSTGLILALDQLQDPGNLGTILRSAEWFGVTDVLLSRGCVDVYNAKVVRGSMGAIFRLSLHKVDLPAALLELKTKGFRIIGTAADASNALPDMVSSERDVLIIGNEGGGLSEEVIESLDQSVKITGGEHGESLNAAVAASIFLYHFSTKRETRASRRQ